MSCARSIGGDGRRVDREGMSANTLLQSTENRKDRREGSERVKTVLDGEIEPRARRQQKGKQWFGSSERVSTMKAQQQKR